MKIHTLSCIPKRCGVCFAFTDEPVWLVYGPDVILVSTHPLPEGKGPQKVGASWGGAGRMTVLTWVGHSWVHQIHTGATQGQGVDGIVGPRVHIRHHDLRGCWGPGQGACEKRMGAHKLPSSSPPQSLPRYVTLGNLSPQSVPGFPHL